MIWWHLVWFHKQFFSSKLFNLNPQGTKTRGRTWRWVNYYFWKLNFLSIVILNCSVVCDPVQWGQANSSKPLVNLSEHPHLPSSCRPEDTCESGMQGSFSFLSCRWCNRSFLRRDSCAALEEIQVLLTGLKDLKLQYAPLMFLGTASHADRDAITAVKWQLNHVLLC